MEYSQLPDDQEKKRPELLTVLCILTFIGSGLGAFANFVFGFSYDTFKEMIDAGELTFPGIETYFAVPRSYYIAGFAVMFVSLMGAIQMWKLRKVGFHIYTIAQIILLILPSILAPNLPYPYINIFITASFIMLYAVNLKHMS